MQEPSKLRKASNFMRREGRIPLTLGFVAFVGWLFQHRPAKRPPRLLAHVSVEIVFFSCTISALSPLVVRFFSEGPRR